MLRTTDERGNREARQGRRPAHRASGVIPLLRSAAPIPSAPASPAMENSMNTWTFGKSSPVRVSAVELKSVGHVGYVLIDTASKTAAVIDPPPDVDPCIEEALRYGARIRHIFLTQFHNDFEAGHQELVARTGAVLYTGAWGRPDYDHLPLKDGDVLQFGNTSLRILETPGHTLEGLTLVASDPDGCCPPWGVFPGELLFDGDLARPEPRLDDGYTTTELAEMLYHSVHRKILPLPSGTRVFSGHRMHPSAPGADLPCLAALRRSLPLLRPQRKRTFVETVTAGMRPAPQSAGTRNRLNRSRGLEFAIGGAGRLPLLDREELLSALENGAVALDLREPMEFAAGHLPGSLSLALGADFEPWAPSLLDPTDDHVLICNPGSEEEAALRLRPLIGFRIRGVFARGLAEFDADSLERSAHLLLEGGRSLRGRSAGRVEVGGSTMFHAPSCHVPLEELLGRFDDLPPFHGAIDVVDADLHRAHAAASLLRRKGWRNVRPVAACRTAARARSVSG